MTYSLATILTEEGDRAAVMAGDRVYRLDRLLPDLPPVGLRGLVDGWDALLDRVDALAPQLASGDVPDDALVEPARLVTPMRYPNKLVCVGAVYSDHLEQMGLPATRWPKMPIFLRPPSTSLVGPGRTVAIPASTGQFDWEIELAVVIARTLTDADEDEAAAAIAGYAVSIDFSCRDLLDRDSPTGVDLVRAKAQDTMAPVGPAIRPARQLGDPQNLALRLWVNGEQRQDGNTANMLFPIREQLATISRFITLEPGDIVMTGSPAGSARSDDQFLRSGDRIGAEIEGVGRLDLELFDAGGHRHALAAE